MTRIEPLEWDTAFFGARIAAVVLGAHDDLDDVAAEADAFECVYLRVSDLADPGTVDDVQAYGFRLVDVAVHLACPAPGVDDSHPDVRPGRSADIAALEPAIEVVVPWSRFSADRRFGQAAARRLYEAWLQRAAATEDELFAVAEVDGTPAGFVTATAHGIPSIGLLSVARPGGGVGGQLIAAARAWAAQRGDQLETTTQARNAGALRFYENQGFRVVRARYVFHRWTGCAAAR